MSSAGVHALVVTIVSCFQNAFSDLGITMSPLPANLSAGRRDDRLFLVFCEKMYTGRVGHGRPGRVFRWSRRTNNDASRPSKPPDRGTTGAALPTPRSGSGSGFTESTESTSGAGSVPVGLPSLTQGVELWRDWRSWRCLRENISCNNVYAFHS